MYKMSATATADEKAVEKFREYLRIPTVQPNINYDDCVSFLIKYAQELALKYEVFTFVSKKPIVLMTWDGLEPNSPTILLNNHMDVVPVFEDKWIHPPFDAHMDTEGNIFARGSQDMKCVGIMQLEAIRRMKNQGVQLKRTIHLSFVPDEEINSFDGMGIFVTSPQFAKLNIGLVLDEGLPMPTEIYPVTYGEKILWQIHVHCIGTPGHGCSLHKNTAGEKFRYILNKFLSLRDENQKIQGDDMFTKDEVTTINLTRIYGGVQENVVPDKLTAAFDLRISTLVNLDEFEAMLNAWCSEAGPTVSIEFIKKEKRRECSDITSNNPYWVAFQNATKRMNLKIKTMTSPATADSRFIREIGIPAFGFTPINNTPMRLHGDNEFINKAKLIEGIKIYEEILRDICNI